MLDFDALEELGPQALRELVPGFIANYVLDAGVARVTRDRMAAHTCEWDDEAAMSVVETLRTLGDEFHRYDANPCCRSVVRVWSIDMIPQVEVSGVEHLEAALRQGPVVVIMNHSSYMDSNGIDVALVRSGEEELANKLVSAAGPKVYSDLFRRLASSSMNTLPVPQSTKMAHTARLSRRQLAEQAVRSFRQAREVVDGGDILLLFPEGSRTRNGRMQPFLKAAARYLRPPGLNVVPAALTGTRSIMPVGRPKLIPGTVGLHFGRALDVAELGGTQQALIAAHNAIASLLPESRTPLSGQPVLG